MRSLFLSRAQGLIITKRLLATEAPAVHTSDDLVLTLATPDEVYF